MIENIVNFIFYNFVTFRKPASCFGTSTCVWMRMSIPCGLVARIWRSHRHGPGSIPGMGNILERRLVTFFGGRHNYSKFFSNLIKFGEKVFKISIMYHIGVNGMKSFWEPTARWWFSGRILACHAWDRGSIPRQRNVTFKLIR